MKYTSCFIGIPLPARFQVSLAALSLEIHKLCPNLNMADITSSHITVYYLDEQSQMNLAEIISKVEDDKYLLHGSYLHVGGIGLFTPERPKVLYFQVALEPSLVDFNAEISKILGQYSALENKLAFTPHITIGRIPAEALREFELHKNEINLLLGKIAWSFEIETIAIYGVDSRIQPEKQSKLMEICL